MKIGARAWVMAVVMSGGCWSLAAWAIPVYEVHVLSANEEVLAKVKPQVPDAFLAISPQPTPTGSVKPTAKVSPRPAAAIILAGTFRTRDFAEKRKQELEKLGLSVKVVTRTETDPALQPTQPQTSAPTTQPQATQPQATPTPAKRTATPSGSANNNPSPPNPKPNLSPTNASTRPYAVLVPNPSNDANLAASLRRYFPAAKSTAYQQQPALQTGTFSQLAQAQEQARWLTTQGFAAVAIDVSPSPPPTPTLTPTPVQSSATPAPTPIPTSASIVGEKFWVLVADPTGKRLSELKKTIPTALPLIYDQLQVVKTGGFSTRPEAQVQVSELMKQGHEAGIFAADLRRSKPVLEPSGSTSSPVPDPLGFTVIVPDQAGSDRLSKVRALSPDAYIRQYQNESVIQVGTYRQKVSAEEALQALSKLGLTGRILSN